VFSWCCNCVELHLEVWYTTPSYEWQQYEEDISVSETERWIAQLKWMSSLQKFTYIKKGSHHFDHLCFNELLNWYWLLIATNDSQVKQLWVQGGLKENLRLKSGTESSITHLCLGYKTDFNHELSKITHLGGIHSFSSLPHLPHLKFMQGYCSSSEVRAKQRIWYCLIDYQIFLFLSRIWKHSVNCTRTWSICTLLAVTFSTVTSLSNIKTGC